MTTPDPSHPEMSALFKGDKGDKGDKGERGEQGLIGTAEVMVARLVKADRRRKWQVRILGVACVVLIAVASIGGWNVRRTSDLTNTVSANSAVLRQQSIQNCENNDNFRLSQIDIWEKNYELQAQEAKATATQLTALISVLANNDPTRIAQINAILAQSNKASANEITQFLNVVKADDAPKNCQALYAAPHR